MRPRPRPGRRNVKSAPATATDAHERRKDFLSETEIAALLDAAKDARQGVRDHLLILAMFRHGLRVSEAIGLRRDEVDLDHARLWIRRLKNGLAVEHPIAGDELRAIKALFWNPDRCAALALHLGARAAAHTPVREQPRRHGCGTGRAGARPPPHATPLMRLLPRQSRLRSAADPGLPRASRPEAHGSITQGSQPVASRGSGDDSGRLRGLGSIWRLREDEIGVRLDALRAAGTAHLGRRDRAGDFDSFEPANGGRRTDIERATACRRVVPPRIAFITCSQRSIDSANILSQPLRGDRRSA